MIKKYIYISIVTFLFAISGAVAQTDYSNQFTVENKVEKKQNDVFIHLNIILDQLQLKSAHMLVLTPVLEAEDKSMIKEFAPVVITGRNKQKSLNRAEALNEEVVFATEPYMTLRRQNKESQNVPYEIVVPYEKWMNKGRLIIREEVYGCADCDLGQNDQELRYPLLKEPYKATFMANFIVPEVEEIKNRDEVQELRLNYKVGKWDVLPEFGVNAQELDKFAQLYNNVKNNEDLNFTGVEIIGYASPEGTYESNMKLSENRARSLAAFLQKKHNLAANFFTLDWKGEDWEGLVKALENYEIQDKARILEIIRTVDVHNNREKQIMELSGGVPYKIMLKELFPPLRRNKVTVNYTVQQFNLEKSREVIKTNPKLLSLNEMYLVANSYPKGSPEYLEAFKIAAQFYPNSPAAANNAAAAEIEKGNYDEAMRILDYNGLKEDKESWNNIGVILAHRKKYAEAKEFFSRSVQATNIAEAIRNLEEVTKKIEDIEEYGYDEDDI